MAKQKKTIDHLRDEILLAHRFFRSVSIEPDHIVCTIDYSAEGFDNKKQELKKYILANFQKVLHVDLFSDYFVIWHYSHLVSEQHLGNKRTHFDENGE